MILSRRQRNDGLGINQRKDRSLLSDQALLHQHPVAGIPERASETFARKFAGLGTIPGHQHAFAGRQPVGLDHNGPGAAGKLIFDIRHRGGGTVERGGFGARNIVLDHELLGKVLAAFEPGGELVRPENGQSAFFEHIHDPGAQRGLRPGHGKLHAVVFGKVRKFIQFGNFDVNAFRRSGDTGVAGRAINLVHQRALCQLPAKHVFASAVADH
ncbi:hypothetical protein SDC9_143007 [bioreactor metagenome]|uniref:Uncharacterized protein n=1 Tax=bioreactor metagenome TaxID=1076179 RepID=A0A645E5K6_9ZZZZ